MIERSQRKWNRWAMAAVAAVAVAACAIGFVFWRKPAAFSDPSNWVQITNFPDSVNQPALSPDGKTLVFVRGPGTFYTPGQVYEKKLPDGEPKQLTNDDVQKMSPVFSSNGSRIAYTTVDSHFNWDTWSIPASGGEPTKWLNNASGLVWIDSQNVMFSEMKPGHHMLLMAGNVEHSAVRQVYDPALAAGMAHRSFPSPDGKWALVVEMAGTWLPCRLISLDGSSAGRPAGPQRGACTAAAWSPDGKWMYFSSSADGRFHLWRQRFAGGEPEQMTTGPSEEEGVAVEPDGRSLITALGQRQRPLMLRAGGRERQISLEGYAYGPKFSPDGKYLLYRILKGAQVYTDATQLWVYNMETGHSEQVLPGFSMIGSGTYDISPDETVVVAARDGAGNHGLWLSSLDHRSTPQMIPRADGDWVVFGKPGEVFFRSTDGYAYRVREDGTGLTRVVQRPVERVYGLSPDKQWLVVLEEKVAILPLNGDGPIRLQTDGCAKWSPDSEWFYFEAPRGGMTAAAAGKTYAIPLHPGELIPKAIRDGLRAEGDLARLPGARVIEAGDVAPGVGPDVYAYSRETTQRNLFRIPIP
jgi:Tol biopolymer transport system component